MCTKVDSNLGKSLSKWNDALLSKKKKNEMMLSGAYLHFICAFEYEIIHRQNYQNEIWL